jgi:hypothetical protein
MTAPSDTSSTSSSLQVAWLAARLAASVLLLWMVWRLHQQAQLFGLDAWGVADWLINYSGGFIRRGLAGDVLMWWSVEHQRPLLELVVSLKSALYAVVGLYLVVRVWTLALTRWPDLLLLLAPWGLAFGVIDPQGGGRKEVFLLAAWVAWIAVRSLVLRTPWSARLQGGLISAVVLLLSMTVVLIHEGMVVFMPFWMLFAIGAHGWSVQDHGARLELGAIVVGSLLGLLPSLLAMGTVEQAIAICQSVVSQGISVDMCQGAIAAVGSQPDFPIKLSVYVPVYAGLAVASFVPLLARAAWQPAGRSRRWVSLGMMLCIALTLPLYAVGIDWGRWIHVASMSSVFLILELAPSVGSWGPRPRWTGVALLLVAAVYLFNWRLPHCCVDSGSPTFWFDSTPAQWLNRMAEP